MRLFTKILIGFVFTALLFANYTTAQDQVSANVEHKLFSFDNADSPISRDVRDLVMDDFGFAWLATDKGAVRFDGSHFFEFNNQNKDLFFPGSAVDYLLYHDQELYLVSKRDGLLSLNTQTFEINYLIEEGVFSIAVDRVNNVVYAYTDDNRLVELIDGQPVKETVVGDSFGIIEVTENGVYLLVKNDAVYFVDRESFEEENLTADYGYPLPTGFREEIVQLDNNTVLLNTDRKLIKVSEDGLSNPEYITQCSSNKNYLLLESNSRVGQSIYEEYYFCDNILYRGKLESNAQKQFIKRFDVNLEIKRMLRINQDDLLLATNQGVRLLKISSGKVQTVNDGILNELSKPRVRRAIVAMDNNELLLLGSPEIYKMDIAGNIEPLKCENKFLYFDAIGIDNEIYATTEGQGFVKLNGKGEVVDHIYSQDAFNNIFYSIQELNKHYLIAGSKGYVSIFDKDLSVLEDIPISAMSDHIRNDDIIMDILIDDQNRGIWLATESGLSLFNTDLSREIKFYSNSGSSPIKLNNRSHSSLLQSETGDTLWIGGDKGIDVLDIENESYIRFIENWNHNTNTKVTGLVKDHSGNIWASTFDGIIVFDNEKEDIFIMDRNIGLINQEFNYKSLLVAHSGKVVMGGVSGYDIIDTDIIDEDFSSDLYITKIEYQSVDENILKPYFFKPEDDLNMLSYRTDKKSIRLFFSVLDPANADNYVFEYKIDDSPWLNVDSNNSILLNNLAYGTYRLKVRARNPLGQIVENNVDLSIEATVPIYYKSSFHTTVIIFFSLMIIGFFYYVSYSYKRESKIKDEISMDLHDVVGTSLARSAILMQEYMEPANTYHQRILQNLQESQFSLRSFIATMSIHELTFEEMIVKLHDTLFQLLSDEMEYELIIDKTNKYRETYNGELFRDIQYSLYELSTNTIKHANAKKIIVTINQINEYLIIEFKDDGKLKNLSKLERGEGYGLQNLKKRLDRYQGELVKNIGDCGTGLTITLKFKT